MKSAGLQPCLEVGLDRGTTNPRTPRPVGGPLKRALDIAIAGTALVLASPLLLAVGIAIKAHDGGPMFYGHTRLGHAGRKFRCLKLRSMVTDGDKVLAEHLAANPAAQIEWQETRKLKADPRVTAVGRFLRKTSLDELPQLINIVRGDMSIVGPRPVTEAELAYYGAARRYYNATRPGLTGLWQVSGRSDVDFARRVALDTYYVRRWSMWRDLAILARTPIVVIKGSGSY